MTLGWLVAISLGGLVIALPVGGRFPRVWLGLVLGSGGGLLGAAFAALTRSTEWDWVGGFPISGEYPHLRLDAVAGIFLVPIAVIGGAGAVYASGYWSDRERADSAGRGRIGWSVLMLCMALVVLASNGLHFLMAWEAFALAGYFLITLDRERREARAAGWLYLAASHAGTLVLFAFFGLLAVRTGGWELGPFRSRGDLAPLFWLALLGFGVKAGMVPFQFWLPSAHAGAPSHVSALLSAVAIKMGLYGIVRFGGWLPLPPGAGGAVLACGAVSAVVGATLALAQGDLKRLLAYCSVENMGVILVGLGAGMLGTAPADGRWGRLAIAGAFLHVWNHALFKALLFFGAGSVLHATGTREMSALGGLWRRMPWTAALFGFGAAAVAALPPFNGFVGEWLIYLGLFDSATGPGPRAAATVPAVIALGVTGALALAAFVKASAVVFLGAARTGVAAEAHECGWRMRAPMVFLAGLSLVLALGPAAVWPFLRRAVDAWNPGWIGVKEAFDPGFLGDWQRGLAVFLVLAVGVLGLRVRGTGVRRAPTWDCGYAAPTGRMQYTSGSFGDLLVTWLRRVLRPEFRGRRLRGLFPAAAWRSERVPEPVLERVLEPAAAVVLGASAWVRRRQHGRLPDYILYLVAGLAAVGVLVFVGSTS